MEMAGTGDRVAGDGRAQDPAAGFEVWYRDTYPRVARSLAVMVGDVEVGRDLAAEAFSRAYERWGKPDALRSPDAWVLTVGINLGRRRWRRQRLEARHAGDIARATSPDTETVDPQLWAAVAALSRREREAVVLRYVADLRERDIAEVMGVEPGTVAATLHRARAHLRRALEGTDHA